ncbi:MAG: M23 family metallopeptidase [Bacteroidales bacterium]
MHRIIFVLYLLTIFFKIPLSAQKNLPQDYFRLPLDIKPVITGFFGELRANHFHTGLDFSTEGKKNIEVCAIANGYVSRIKVSPFGYGKAIYITHPNGFVSVYGHLNNFNIIVDDYVKKQQYEQQSFEIELFPNPELFKINKGDIIGYSGNTGASSGPHLHFEIRSELSERPINPLLFGYKITDNDKPVIKKICIVPANRYALINEKNEKYWIEPVVKNNEYQVKDTSRVSGSIYLGVVANDIIGYAKYCGIYSIEVHVDSALFFKIGFDSISFDEGRYVNTLIDYNEYSLKDIRQVNTYKAPGNRLNIYKHYIGNGTLFFNDTNYHRIKITVTDFNENMASSEMIVKSVTLTPPGKTQEKNAGTLIHYGIRKHFEDKNLIIDIPPDAFFDSVYFDYGSTPQTKETYSDIYSIHNKFTPLFASVSIKIKPNQTANSSMQNKLCIARVRNNSYEYINSKWKNGFLCADIRQFGNYCIVSDTIIPEIKPEKKYIKIKSGDVLRFKIKDNFSGIGSYNLTMNGKWVLAEYDAKISMLTYFVEDNHLLIGENELVLSVSDKLNNKNVYKTNITFE